ncbi:MAG: glycosyltransferase [Candidatus Saganbacteria bacterium]|nr:glycosyltransferase [Candidatus Saganbacteria bacterium]
MKKKILYLFSDTGGGHRSAATAIMKAVEHVKPNTFEQTMVDVFAECSGFLNIFAKLYAPVIKYSPKLWGRLYYWLDDEDKLQMLEKIAKPFILKELEKLLKEKKPDLVVSVHPMVNHLTVKALKSIKKKPPVVVVITDPVSLHRAWVAPEVNLTVVATEEAKKHCLEYGMPAEKIKIVGMPIDPKFALKGEEKRKARIKSRLKPRLFTVLMMGGGEGAGGLFEIVEKLNDTDLKIQVIVIAGRNKHLEQKLKRRASQYRFPLRVYGFTDQVAELMKESDLLVTKAGPGSIAEALAMDLPIIITSWLPGQEEGNVEFVVREDIGRVAKEPERVVRIIQEMQQPKEYLQIKKNIERVRKPHAALDIAKLLLRYV